MATVRRRKLRLTIIGVILVLSSAMSRRALPPRAGKLKGEEARTFLAQSGILSAIEEDVAPEGRPFLEAQAHHATDSASADNFGFAVAVSGDTALVGAYGADIGGNGNQGAAYVFTRDGNSWSQQQKLVAADGALADNFARSAALDGNTALIGADRANYGAINEQGSIYFFERQNPGLYLPVVIR